MPRGLQSKQLATTERQPESWWNYNCNGEIIKTCKNKRDFELWIKLHLKNCIDCKQRRLCLSETKIQTQTGQLKTID
jgi:hypothetical protein